MEENIKIRRYINRQGYTKSMEYLGTIVDDNGEILLTCGSKIYNGTIYDNVINVSDGEEVFVLYVNNNGALGTAYDSNGNEIDRLIISTRENSLILRKK